MRLYVKLILMTSAFAFLVSATGRRMAGNLAYEIRVALVCALGNDADYERLIEDTWRTRFPRIEPAHVFPARERAPQLNDVDDSAMPDVCDDGIPPSQQDWTGASADGRLEPPAPSETTLPRGHECPRQINPRRPIGRSSKALDQWGA